MASAATSPLLTRHFRSDFGPSCKASAEQLVTKSGANEQLASLQWNCRLRRASRARAASDRLP